MGTKANFMQLTTSASFIGSIGGSNCKLARGGGGEGSGGEEGTAASRCLKLRILFVATREGPEGAGNPDGCPQRGVP